MKMKDLRTRLAAMDDEDEVGEEVLDETGRRTLSIAGVEQTTDLGGIRDSSGVPA